MNWPEAITFLSKGNCLREILLVLTIAINKWNDLNFMKSGWGTHQHDQKTVKMNFANEQKMICIKHKYAFLG